MIRVVDLKSKKAECHKRIFFKQEMCYNVKWKKIEKNIDYSVNKEFSDYLKNTKYMFLTINRID